MAETDWRMGKPPCHHWRLPFITGSPHEISPAQDPGTLSTWSRTGRPGRNRQTLSAVKGGPGSFTNWPIGKGGLLTTLLPRGHSNQKHNGPLG